jgi:hypothetical protein
MKQLLGAVVSLLSVAVAPLGAARAQCITAYTDASFSGTATNFCNGEPFRNDAYSSYRVPPGMRLRAFEHGDGSGIARTYFEDTSWVGWLYNDKASMLRWGSFDTSNFAMITASDPQFSWGYCEDNSGSGECQTERNFFPGWSQEDISRTYNANVVNAMDAVGGYFGEGRLGGAIVNGDLTEFGDQGSDLGDYISLYEHGLAMNVYLGLGNHDYQNNVDDCSENRCANTMVWYLRDQVQTLDPVSFDYSETGVYYAFPSNRKRHEGSLGYSWNIGRVHFVQLNNHPAYERSWSGWNFGSARRDEFVIRQAMAWLRNDLTQARSQGKTIILNLHDWGAVRNNAELRSILNDFPVSAVYAGHWHGTIGQWEQIGPFADGRTIPVLLSGSAQYGSFLVTQYLSDRMRVWVMRVDHFHDARLRVQRSGGDIPADNLGNVFGNATWSYEYGLR